MTSTSSLGGMSAKRWPGDGRSHSVVAIRRMAGETQNRLPSSGSYANTLDRASPDAVVAVTTREHIATVIADVPQIVSLFCLPRMHTVEPNPWKAVIEGLVVDVTLLKAKVDISVMMMNVHALKLARNAIRSSAFHAMLGRYFCNRPLWNH